MNWKSALGATATVAVLAASVFVVKNNPEITKIILLVLIIWTFWAIAYQLFQHLQAWKKGDDVPRGDGPADSAPKASE